MHNEHQTAGNKQVSQDTLEANIKLAHSGLSPEDISCPPNIDIETVNQMIANDPMHRARLVHEDNVPTFIYSYKGKTEQLHRSSLWRTVSPSIAFIHIQ
jgi:hypothetical protein